MASAAAGAGVVLTTNREALRLYRQILRCTKKFVHPNQEGTPWRTVLRQSARREYEQARYEQDPEVVARLLVVGKDCIMQVQEQMEKKLHQMGIPSPKKPVSPYGWED